MIPSTASTLIDASGRRIENWFWACDKTGFVGEVICENGEPVRDILGEIQVAISQYDLPFRLEEQSAATSL